MSLAISSLIKVLNWKFGIQFKFQCGQLIEAYAKLSHFQTVLVQENFYEPYTQNKMPFLTQYLESVSRSEGWCVPQILFQVLSYACGPSKIHTLWSLFNSLVCYCYPDYFFLLLSFDNGTAFREGQCIVGHSKKLCGLPQ